MTMMNQNIRNCRTGNAGIAEAVLLSRKTSAMGSAMGATESHAAALHQAPEDDAAGQIQKAYSARSSSNGGLLPVTITDAMACSGGEERTSSLLTSRSRPDAADLMVLSWPRCMLILWSCRVYSLII